MIWRGAAVSVTLPAFAVAIEPFGSWKIGWLNALNMSTRKSNVCSSRMGNCLCSEKSTSGTTAPRSGLTNEFPRPEFEAIGITFGHKGLAQAKAFVSKNRSTVRSLQRAVRDAVRPVIAGSDVPMLTGKVWRTSRL